MSICSSDKSFTLWKLQSHIITIKCAQKYLADMQHMGYSSIIKPSPSLRPTRCFELHLFSVAMMDGVDAVIVQNTWKAP